MEENVKETKTEKGISLVDLWIILKKYWLQLVVFTVIATVAAGILASSLVQMTYTASIRLILNPNNVYKTIATNASQQRVVNEFGLSVYPSLKDFLTTTNVVTKIVGERDENYIDFSKIDKTKIDKSVGKGNISCTQVEDSLMFTITYTTSSSKDNAIETVKAISYALIKISQLDPNGQEVDPNDEKPQYLYPFGGMLYHDENLEKDISSSASKPWKLYPILTFVVVFVLLYVYFLLINIFDDSVKSKAEIEEITDFNVIAFIEDITEQKKKKKNA